jgi:hypothetical protein
VIYAVIAIAVIVVYSWIRGDSVKLGVIAGLLVSGPVYLLFGAALAKLGVQRKTLKELRAEREAIAAQAPRQKATTPAGRAKPAPTRRTSTGPSQHRKSGKPKRR